ncbi:zinc-finger homeodomain protein 6-like [Gastrolobium bilobum]|uniref:zinc-finger homeodomain protein 6-like n=1 Tax=Gastrolobium bilobum TaxID=150636 RepID=UPI002AB31CBF|nr:zinc-finger homeodomain protein 6-like [Gastrolobium bilobum]
MDMRDQVKELEMPTTVGYNLPNRVSSSSKLSSSTLGERSDQTPQTHTLIFSDPPQTAHHSHLSPPFLPPNPIQLQQPIRPRRDPDPNSSYPIATTSRTSTPIASGSNPTRTETPPPQPPLPQTARTRTRTTTTSIRYRECLKNHAASMGGHVIDGCGEFMPSGEDGTPESMKCAACDCHRNFHRKEAEGEPQHVLNYHSYYYNKSNGQNRIHSLLHHHRLSSHGVATTSAGLIQPMTVAVGGSGGGPAESSSEDLNMFQCNDGVQLSVQQPPLSKKRFRTKFTQQQKERMMELAEKLGWKIQKQDEHEVQQICSQLGVKRQVFKIWMHNSKQAMKKKQM